MGVRHWNGGGVGYLGEQKLLVVCKILKQILTIKTHRPDLETVWTGKKKGEREGKKY